MKTIKMYSANAQSSDGGATKGSSGNPYTQEEYESMLDAGTWPGGYVQGMGYVLPCVEVWGSSSGSSDYDSDSWSDPWGDASDPWGDTEEDKPTGPTGGGGGSNNNNGGSQGGGSRPSGGNNSGFPTPPLKIDIGQGVKVYSKRLFKTKLSTLSFFTAVAYDENGNMLPSTKVNGYFLERVIDYNKATISGSKTAILKGEYNIIPGVSSQKYNWYLQNVPGRSGIAIHKGNYYYDSTGCLLPGENYTYNSKEDIYSVLNSGKTLDSLSQLFKTYGNGNITITITESF